jgi:hypothetical protein
MPSASIPLKREHGETTVAAGRTHSGSFTPREVVTFLPWHRIGTEA